MKFLVVENFKSPPQTYKVEDEGQRFVAFSGADG